MFTNFVAKKEDLCNKFINWIFPTETQEDSDYICLMFNRFATGILIVLVYVFVLSITVLLLKCVGI